MKIFFQKIKIFFTKNLGEAGGERTPPEILENQKAPPAVAARRITVRPPRFLDFGTYLLHKP